MIPSDWCWGVVYFLLANSLLDLEREGADGEAVENVNNIMELRYVVTFEFVRK